MARCLRCDADSSWISGRVPDEKEMAAFKLAIRRLRQIAKHKIKGEPSMAAMVARATLEDLKEMIK